MFLSLGWTVYAYLFSFLPLRDYMFLDYLDSPGSQEVLPRSLSWSILLGSKLMPSYWEITSYIYQRSDKEYFSFYFLMVTLSHLEMFSPECLGIWNLLWVLYSLSLLLGYLGLSQGFHSQNLIKTFACLIASKHFLEAVYLLWRSNKEKTSIPSKLLYFNNIDQKKKKRESLGQLPYSVFDALIKWFVS